MPSAQEMHERVVAYIDGFNLYFGLKSAGWKRYYWLNLQLLAQNLLKDGQELVFTEYFTSRVTYPPEKERNMKAIVTKGDLSDLSSDNPKVKYRQAKRLVAVAKKNPDQVFPHRAFFLKLLKSENNILKWIAIDILGHLSGVNKKTRVDGLLDTLVGFLQGGKLVTASHAIAALSNVALARPEYQDRITQELLKVEKYKYETDECGNIALGKVVQAVGSYSTHLRLDADVLKFVRRQTINARPATRKKAQKFLSDVGKL